MGSKEEYSPYIEIIYTECQMQGFTDIQYQVVSMASPRHWKAALAVVQMDRLATQPTLARVEQTKYEPARDTEITVEATTTRQRVHQEITEADANIDRDYRDTHISVQDLAKVLDCSDSTARRRLEFLKEKGIVHVAVSADKEYYAVNREFTASDSGTILSGERVVEITHRLFEALEE